MESSTDVKNIELLVTLTVAMQRLLTAGNSLRKLNHQIKLIYILLEKYIQYKHCTIWN